MTDSTSTATTSAAIAFDPSRYLTRINNGEYLEVKWRLVWLREAHPDATISTELHRFDEQQAVFKATVSIPGGGSATGWGSESPGDFRDFLEKAETKALGRALAALGFGTQFCPDFEFGAGQQRVVDAPIRFDTTQGAQQARRGQPTRTAAQGTDDQAVPTPRQTTYLTSVAREARLNQNQLDEIAREKFGVAVSDLGRKDMSSLIDHIKSMGDAPTQLAS